VCRNSQLSCAGGRPHPAFARSGQPHRGEAPKLTPRPTEIQFEPSWGFGAPRGGVRWRLNGGEPIRSLVCNALRDQDRNLIGRLAGLRGLAGLLGLDLACMLPQELS
jgi:hypothetical protein